MKARTPIRLNIGSIMIMMLFAVVCLVLLASLSLLAANSQLRAAQRIAEQSNAYYAAECKAVEVYETVTGGNISDVDIQVATNGNGDFISYTVPVDENRALEVYIEVHDHTYISAWQLVSTREWLPEGGVTLWDDEEEAIFGDW